MRRDFPIHLGRVTAAFVLIGTATDTITPEYYAVELLPSAGN